MKENENGILLMKIKHLDSPHCYENTGTTDEIDGLDGLSPTNTTLDRHVSFSKDETVNRHPNCENKEINGGSGLDPTDVSVHINDGHTEISKDESERRVGTRELFRYATPSAVLLMIIGSFGACLQGAAIPVNIAVFGEVINVFLEFSMTNTTNSTSTEGDELVESMMPYIFTFLGIAGASFIGSFLGVACWQWASEIQLCKIRKEFFSAVMKQEIGWFDLHESGEISSRFSEDIGKISGGLNDKMSYVLQWMTTVVGCFIMAFSREWRLTLAALAFSPLIMLTGALVLRMFRTFSAKEFKAYAKAGSVAEQSLRAVRTVQAFQCQEKMIAKYKENLTDAVNEASKKGLAIGLGHGMIFFLMFTNLAAVMWIGTVLIQNEHIVPALIIPVFLGVLIGSFSLANSLNNLEDFGNARGAATRIFDIIDKTPEIDSSSDEGITPDKMLGRVVFENVMFAYPSRPHSTVLTDLNIVIEPGQHLAFVGPSGCGKSTTVQLIQRFYDALEGQVKIDGHDIRSVNLKWLRNQIGVVSQEPVLFNTTIGQNIRFGHLEASEEDMKQAAKDANAHDFISALPDGYDTRVGERGAQLSGGQKQRIAIARALLRNPKILLLDEATSALDHESEAIVQSALDKAGIGRTTITIAHRLSTVRNSDKIIAFSGGEAIEEGTHDQLMEERGLYSQLVQIQANIEKESKLDIADVQIVEEDFGEGEISDIDIMRSSYKRSTSRSSATSRVLVKQVSLVAQESKRRSKGKASITSKTIGQEVEDEVVEAVPFSKVFKYNAPEWHFILLGSLTSIVMGCVQPGFSFLMSEFIKVLSTIDHTEQMNQVNILGCTVIGIAVVAALCRMFQNYCFSRSGARLTARLRSLTFTSIINQDMEYFDHPKNQVGAIASILSSDASMVQGVTGSKIGEVISALSTICSALTIAFVFGWKLAFVVISFLPLMVVAGIVQGKALMGAAKKDRSQLQDASSLCSEVVDNIRTVASITREEYFVHKVGSLVDQAKDSNKKSSIVTGITSGVGNSIVFFAYSVSFYYGSTLVQDGDMEFYNVFRVFSAIIFGAQVIGRQFSLGIDFSKAKVAASRIIHLIDRVPKVDVRKASGVQLDKFRGSVVFKNTVFHYPTRPNIAVLNGMDLTISPGEKVALVGASGCGKSTTTQLIERFYDVNSGGLCVDDVDIRDVNLTWYRQQLGIVSQEPTLFDTTIAQNIAYGDTSREVDMAEITEAARQANIHNFVASLPQGYQTNVGDKGAQLSGGQKQRIAIARALVRNPKVLLLDEATSALDTESEKVVQDALDRVSDNRTCIIIAHRLSTIQNADKIAVVSKGKIVELGTHNYLMTIKGSYYRLQKAQNKVHN